MLPHSKNHIPDHWIVSLTGRAILLAFVYIMSLFTSSVTAQANDNYGPACGSAALDGIVDPAEWSSASTQTFAMVTSSSETLTATLYVMNNASHLYMGITINDDEFSTQAQFLPQGDGFRIDFDNDHSGLLFTPGDDMLAITAGLPQFEDNYLIGPPSGSSTGEDVSGGGTSDGSGAASRVGALNHFELRHPLCSGDALDFCLQPGDTVGFRLEYLDGQGVDWGGSHLYPGREDTSIADIGIGTCSQADLSIYLPIIRK